MTTKTGAFAAIGFGAHFCLGFGSSRRRRSAPGREIPRDLGRRRPAGAGALRVEPNADSKILNLPVLITVGDMDSLMASARTFGEQLKALNATVEYREFAGLDHGTIILGSQPEVFAFFAAHVNDQSVR
jgi:acetyl esterase/lipase